MSGGVAKEGVCAATPRHGRGMNRDVLVAAAPSPRARVSSWSAWRRGAFAHNPAHNRRLSAALRKAASFELASWSPLRRRRLLLCAVLHDIGLAFDPDQKVMHAAAGAGLLAEVGLRDAAAVVARHAGAVVEAELRGREREFDPWRKLPYDADVLCVLDWIDATISPAGEDVSWQQRLEDIRARYGHDSPQALTFEQNRANVERGERIATAG